MPIPQTAYDQIEERVKQFKALSKRERDAYNEDNTRKDFILPLFRALEWNVGDMREVAAEEKISRGYVDFSFRIGGVPRFMLETKRIGEDLNKPEWAQQHDAIVALVEEMLSLQKEFADQARRGTPHEDALKRRIAETDAAIDAAVYRLYDLSAGEIAIVENKT